MKLHAAGLLVLMGALLSVPTGFATSPLPSSYATTGTPLGVHLGVSITAGSYLYQQVATGGGEFAGSVAGASTAFWCVDDQIYFAPPQSGLADIVTLANINANEQYVRYGNLTNSSTPGWLNTTDGGSTPLALPPDPQSRYEMEAYLISQYAYATGGVGGNTDSGLVSGGYNDAIQEAIWSITHNNDSSFESNSGAPNYIGSPGVQGWIDQALANYQAYFKAHGNEWAVVSWGVKSDGTLNTGNGYGDPTNDALQTFMVQIAPEPGFYGALAMGLSGLVFFIRRKRKAS